MLARDFFGGLFLVIGGLIAILSGGCTLLFIIVFLNEALASGKDLSAFFDVLWVPLLFGGIPFIAGVILFWIGRLIRGKRNVG